MHRIVNAVFTLFDFNFCCAANFDNCNTARKLRKPLLQLLTVVVRRWTPRPAHGFDCSALRFLLCAPPSTIVVSSLVISTRLAEPSISSVKLSSVMPTSSDTTVTVCKNGNIFQHGFPAIAKTRGLNSCNFQATTKRLTTKVAKASPSMSSAMINNGRPD